MIRALLALTCAAALAVCSGCGGSSSNPIAPIPGATFSQVDLVVGGGTQVQSGSRLSITYTGWLYDANNRTDQKGTQFDTNAGGTPYVFVVGAGLVIRGVDQGVIGMRVGGTRRIIIPPDLGYGSAANGPIPANSTLIFEITAVDVQ